MTLQIPEEDLLPLAIVMAQANAASNERALLQLRSRVNSMEVARRARSEGPAEETLNLMQAVVEQRRRVMKARSAIPSHVQEKHGYPRELKHEAKIVIASYHVWFDFYTTTYAEGVDLRPAIAELREMLRMCVSPSELWWRLKGQLRALRDVQEELDARSFYRNYTAEEQAAEEESLRSKKPLRKVRIQLRALSYLRHERSSVVSIIAEGL